MKDLQIGVYQPEDDDDLLSSQMKGNKPSSDETPLLTKIALAVTAAAIVYFVYQQATQ